MSQPTTQQPIFTTRGNQPLIGVPVEENGELVTYYFNSEEAAEKAFPSTEESIREVLDLAGAWKELDPEGGPDPLDELDRIRHESKPTPLFKP